ncbi:ABC transporter permease [Candidatus Symbiopectobacterium sp. 'North America']|uniref:FecCD family ABC transporter permease n=1 Tax=Candidatus Symbiopectobacterium sp. 'North America' TaxID=2794574 RepID=UPI0018C9E8CA|nr:iron ABC transporter permease [Candidatus Symbiopectobacterium sp. 'North America']MBG6243844.1 ABC transporter permease [Candidatus Symbiopectobacterium sp. 'North America']
MTSQRYRITLLTVVVGTLLIALCSLGLGSYGLSPWRIVQILVEPLSDSNPTLSDIERQVVWSVRLPRVLLALCAGAGLALSGATLQGVFRNPLVDPHIIGVSAGAAFGGTLAILLCWTPLFLLLSTFTFGMAALLLVFMMAAALGKQNALILILAGVIISGFFGALVSLMQYLADIEEKLPSIVFWLLARFATTHWDKLVTLVLPLGLAGRLLLRLRWYINVLSMGEQDARTLGMAVQPVRWLVLSLCAAVVAAQVAVSGSIGWIGWIGLVIPHVVRMLVGADHRRLLPVLFWLGGGFMVLVDDLARTLSDAEIPLRILTALFGAPLFAVLLYKTQRQRRG